MTDIAVSSSPAHIPVLLNEAVAELLTEPNGFYVDGTFGRGGHSTKILSELGDDARLVAFDKDPEAIAIGHKLALADSRFSIIHDSFSAVDKLDSYPGGSKGITGVLLDLGVSSPQLDQSERGFSFMQDGPLDMRMNPKKGLSAAEWLSEVSVQELAQVLKDYGDERYAKRIANFIVDAQQAKALEGKKIESTVELAEIIKAGHPNWEHNKHPATRAFQAIRIKINGELDDLALALDRYTRQLQSGGRLAVISFHSLEDRLVKRFMREKSQQVKLPKNLPMTDFEAGLEKPKFRLASKAIKASKAELDDNIRARSAVLRVLEKV